MGAGNDINNCGSDILAETQLLNSAGRAALLSAAQYAHLAASIKLPAQAFVDGGFRPALSGETFDTTNPATGKLLTYIASCGPDDVDVAVSNAKAAFEDGRWSRLSPAARKHILLRFADLLEQSAHEMAVMETLDSGKPSRECQNTDVSVWPGAVGNHLY